MRCLLADLIKGLISYFSGGLSANSRYGPAIEFVQKKNPHEIEKEKRYQRSLTQLIFTLLIDKLIRSAL